MVLPGNELKIWELKLRLQAAASGSYQNKSSGTCQAAHMRGEGGAKRRQTETGVELVCLTPPPLPTPTVARSSTPKQKMRGVGGGSCLPIPPPHARPNFFLAGLPGAETPSSPGTGVSHPEEAVTERGSRRTLPGLGGAGREAAARDTRGPNAPSPGPGSPGRLRSSSPLC